MKFIARVILPLILFAYVSIEAILKMQKSSLCHSTGCELAEQLLKFDSMYLYLFGAVGALAIALFGYLSTKRESFSKLFYITLYSAIAFESIMISYQVIANPEPCKFCMGVYGLLLVTALFSSWRYLLYALPVVASIFISMTSLAIPKNKVIAGTDGLYLIQSQTCPHCRNVKEYMKKNNISYTPIKASNTNARSLMKDLNITQIPVLLVKEPSRTQVIKGDNIIIEHLKNSLAMKVSEKSDIYKQKSEGCQADDSITEKKAGCEEGSILKNGASKY